MKENIRKHVNELFQDAPNTKRAFDLKDELIINLQDKYDDLISNGRTEEESYETVIAGIGDVSELIANLETSNPMNDEVVKKERKKTALVVSICVGLYMLAIVSAIVVSSISEAIYLANLPDDTSDFVYNFMEMLAPISLFIISGIPTCILIYHFMSRPKYSKLDTTLVEEFKEWKADKEKDNSIRKAISSILWPIIVSLYFIISFAFNSWAFSWIIYLIGGAIENMITLYFKLKE